MKNEQTTFVRPIEKIKTVRFFAEEPTTQRQPEVIVPTRYAVPVGYPHPQIRIILG